MLDVNAIKRELERSHSEYRHLTTSITNAERDAERQSRKIQAAKNDIETARRNLERQERELETVLKEFKYANEGLPKYKEKQAEYERKIKSLELDLKQLVDQVGKKKSW